MIAAALAYWTHDLDPVAVRFPESWGLRGIHWYGLAYAAGFGDLTWRAYLSTADENARDRIGNGPGTAPAAT
mgnify:CR=1 FL=1